MSFRFRIFIIVAALLFSLLAVFWGLALAQAELIRGYGWSETIGWIKLQGSNYGVVLDGVTGELTGYAWSENIGWIKFGGRPARVEASGLVTGWARACAGAADEINCSGDANPKAGGWDGWIKFSGDNFSTNKIDDPQSDCSFSGWAWGSDVVGWIKFLCIPEKPEPEPEPGDIDCFFAARPSTLIFPRRVASLIWSCSKADSCSISGVGSVNPVSGTIEVDVPATSSFTLSCSNVGGKTFSSLVEIKVVRPIYCEILPFGPGCQ